MKLGLISALGLLLSTGAFADSIHCECTQLSQNCEAIFAIDTELQGRGRIGLRKLKLVTEEEVWTVKKVIPSKNRIDDKLTYDLSWIFGRGTAQVHLRFPKNFSDCKDKYQFIAELVTVKKMASDEDERNTVFYICTMKKSNSLGQWLLGF
jgi:hypothetical protein